MFPFVILAAIGGFIWWGATRRAGGSAPVVAPPLQPQWPTGGAPVPGSDMSKALVTDWVIDVCNSGSTSLCVDSVAIDRAVQSAAAGYFVEVGFRMSRVGPSGGSETVLIPGRLVAATMSPDKRRVSVVAFDSAEKGGAPIPAYLFDNNYASLKIYGGPQPSVQAKSDPAGELKTVLGGADVGQLDYESNTMTTMSMPTPPTMRMAQQYGGDRITIRRPRFWR